MRSISLLSAAAILSLSRVLCRAGVDRVREHARSLHAEFPRPTADRGHDLHVGIRRHAACARLPRRERPEPLFDDGRRLSLAGTNPHREIRSVSAGRRDLQRHVGHERTRAMEDGSSRRDRPRDLAFHATRREGDPLHVGLRGSRRGTSAANHEQRRSIPHLRVGPHAREQALHPGSHRAAGKARAGAVPTILGLARRERHRASLSRRLQQCRHLLERPPTARAGRPSGHR